MMKVSGTQSTVSRSYRVLAWFLRVVVNTFFRRIEVVGLQNVPTVGPVIFAGNHPNALVDGFVVATMCGRTPVHFMGNEKLWRYPLLGMFLDALGAVKVTPREERVDTASNDATFATLFEVLESGNCMGIFPEGISHTGSQLVRLKTGTARIALAVGARRTVKVTLVPCGLTYMHRHRFRSQALIQFGAPVVIDDSWLDAYATSETETVHRLTEHVASALADVTLNAPDWDTLRFIHTARRLYKPASARLTPGTYVELSRRFVERYLATADRPEIRQLRTEVEDYQAQLDLLGLKDHHLRDALGVLDAWKGVLWRGAAVIALLPFAIPGTLFHLPVGWVAMTAGERLSYDRDDVATLKVITAVVLLPLIYLGVGAIVGVSVGPWWGAGVALVLPLTFLASIKIVEIQANMTLATVTSLRLSRFSREVAELRKVRDGLVERVRDVADRHADPKLPRVFSRPDFD